MVKYIGRFLDRLLNIEFVRFGIVGIVATIVHYGIYYSLNLVVNYNIAYTVGYALSFIANFWLSAKFTFKSEPTAKKGVGFALSHLVNYGLQLLVLNIVVKMGASQELAPIPVYLICVPINFLLVRFVFKNI